MTEEKVAIQLTVFVTATPKDDQSDIESILAKKFYETSLGKYMDQSGIIPVWGEPTVVKSNDKTSGYKATVHFTVADHDYSLLVIAHPDLKKIKVT